MDEYIRDTRSNTERLIKRIKDFALRSQIIIFFLGLIILAMNVGTCWKVYQELPLADAYSRPLMAEQSKMFYDSGLSEPLPVFVLKITMLVSKADPVKIIKVQGLLIFIALYFALIYAVIPRYGFGAALYAGVFAAANPYLGYYAMTGTSFMYAALFLVLFFKYADSHKLTKKNAVLAGLFASAALLSRFGSIWFLLLHTLFFLPQYRDKKILKHALLYTLLALFLTSPYLFYQKKQFGNMLYYQEANISTLLNISNRAKNLNKPVYTEPVSILKSIVGDKDGVFYVITNPVKGFIRALSFELPRTVHYKLGIFLAFLGFYFSFVQRRKDLVVLFLSSFIPVCFMADMYLVKFQGGIGLCYYLMPFLAISALAGFGLQEISFYLAKQLSTYMKKQSSL